MPRRSSRVARTSAEFDSAVNDVVKSSEGRKRKPQSAVVENPEDRQASPDEAESQNDELGNDGVQATQVRQPAVNSPHLPLPWKGRLGYAYN
jgi:UV DNA damage endonuclease